MTGIDRPRPFVEQALLAIYAEVLESPELGLDDDFFALGGDSLEAVEITAAVQDAFDVDISVSLVLEHPTVRRFATAMTKSGNGG
jgi:acyl carrier protein